MVIVSYSKYVVNNEGSGIAQKSVGVWGSVGSDAF